MKRRDFLRGAAAAFELFIDDMKIAFEAVLTRAQLSQGVDAPPMISIDVIPVGSAVTTLLET